MLSGGGSLPRWRRGSTRKYARILQSLTRNENCRLYRQSHCSKCWEPDFFSILWNQQKSWISNGNKASPIHSSPRLSKLSKEKEKIIQSAEEMEIGLIDVYIQMWRFVIQGNAIKKDGFRRWNFSPWNSRQGTQMFLTLWKEGYRARQCLGLVRDSFLMDFPGV